MSCKYRKTSYKVVDGELNERDQIEFQRHLQACLACQKEVASIQKLNNLIRTSSLSIEPSLNFEGIFWQKVLTREAESVFSRLLRVLDSFIPTPNFAQAFSILFLALLIGGTGGFVATASTLSPEQIQAGKQSVKYLSGFQEFSGIPSTSVAANYLKSAPERKPS